MIPAKYGLEVYNLYSKKDYATKSWAKKQKPWVEYNVEFLKCITPRSGRVLWLADHYFLEATYQQAMDKRFKGIRKERGFHDGAMR